MRSLSAAADALNVSQPALSRRIAQAEDSLGVLLFERLPRGVRPTDACLAFLRHAETALASIDDAQEAAREARLHTELSIGFIDAICDPWLMDTIGSVLQHFPAIAPVFRPQSLSSEVSADVLAGRVKLGLRYREDQDPHLDGGLVLQDRITVICAPTHPLAKRRAATVEELARQQWLGYPVSADANSFNHILASYGLAAWRTTPIHSLHAQLHLVAGGFGIALMRRANVRRQLEEGSLLEIDTPISTDIPVYLIWRRHAYLGEPGETLRDRLLGADRVEL